MRPGRRPASSPRSSWVTTMRIVNRPGSLPTLPGDLHSLTIPGGGSPFVLPMVPFPSPRPSPLRRGRNVSGDAAWPYALGRPGGGRRFPLVGRGSCRAVDGGSQGLAGASPHRLRRASARQEPRPTRRVFSDRLYEELQGRRYRWNQPPGVHGELRRADGGWSVSADA